MSVAIPFVSVAAVAHPDARTDILRMTSTDESDHYAQILKRLSPATRIAVAQQLRDTAWELAAAGVRMREPDLSEDAVHQRVRTLFTRANNLNHEIERMGLEETWSMIEQD